MNRQLGTAKGDKVEMIDKIFITSSILIMVDLFFIKYWDFVEKKYGIETPAWAVNLSVSSFLILAIIFVISLILAIWN